MWLRLSIVFLQVLGAAIVVYGLNSVREADGLQKEFDSDPVCTRKLTLQTPPRKGEICTIARGKVGWTYTLGGGSKYSNNEDHIVVFVPGAADEDVEIFDDWGSYLKDARDGSPVVLETMDLVPARIATADGAVSASADPHMRYENIWIGSSVGAALVIGGFVPFFYGLAMRLKRA